MKRMFKLIENETTPRIEIRAGLTSFFAMAYIIFLNPVFLSATGMSTEGVLIATCISAALGTLLCALISNKPFALAPGMGMNAFFAYTLCFGYGYTWQQALSITFRAGLLFLVISISPLKNAIINAIPVNLKYAISSGIGLFICFIGLLDANIVSVASGVPSLGDIKSPVVLISLFGIILTAILIIKKVRGNLIIGILATVVLSILTKQTALPDKIVSLPVAVKDVAFKLNFTGLSSPGGAWKLFAVIISMTIVDMFDTLGFLIGTGSRSGMLDEDGNMQWAGKVLTADAAASAIGALCGTSTVTCFAESASGIAAGGKTGMTGLVTALCFVAAAFLSPLASVVSSAAAAPALIIVGLYLMMDFVKINLKDMDDAIPAFLTVVFMPFAYSITSGIAIGFISYVICKLFAGKGKELKLPVIILALVFILYFCI